MDNKYLKYKLKYINLKKQFAGSSESSPPHKLYLNVTQITNMDHMPTALRTIRALPNVTVTTLKNGSVVISITYNNLTETLFNNITRTLMVSLDTIGMTCCMELEGGEFIDWDKQNFHFQSVRILLENFPKLVYMFKIITREELIEQRLIAHNYTSLQIYNIPTGILYKCDYDFTNILYRHVDGRMSYIQTIFDSGNSAPTIIDSANVELLGLELMPIYTTRDNLTIYNAKLDEIFRNVTDINSHRLDENTNIPLVEFLERVDRIADLIRRKDNIDPNDNNEDLLSRFGVSGTRGVGGRGSCTMNRVLLPFEIVGFSGRYYIRADVNNDIKGVLFSKHDMAFLEQRGLSFGYDPNFEDQHRRLAELKNQAKEQFVLYQLEKSRAINGQQRYAAFRNYSRMMGPIELQEHALKHNGHTEVISIYRTILPLDQGHLDTTPRGTHVQAIYDPTPDNTTLIFTNLFNRIEQASRDIRDLLFERIGRIGFTVDQLTRLREISEN